MTNKEINNKLVTGEWEDLPKYVVGNLWYSKENMTSLFKAALRMGQEILTRFHIKGMIKWLRIPIGFLWYVSIG